MRYLKSYQKFENCSGAGSGDISRVVPSRKERRKKGNPSEVSDLRDLEEADVEEVDDLKESKKKFPNIKKSEIDGFEVLIGKDAESNDYLTMQMRQDGDLWFHAHGFPGSHIILRCGTRIPDFNTKKKVAELAAKNSKASGLATVICCPIYLVKKEPGSNAGKVKVENNLNIEKIDIDKK